MQFNRKFFIYIYFVQNDNGTDYGRGKKIKGYKLYFILIYLANKQYSGLYSENEPQQQSNSSSQQLKFGQTSACSYICHVQIKIKYMLRQEYSPIFEQPLLEPQFQQEDSAIRSTIKRTYSFDGKCDDQQNEESPSARKEAQFLLDHLNCQFKFKQFLEDIKQKKKNLYDFVCLKDHSLMVLHLIKPKEKQVTEIEKRFEKLEKGLDDLRGTLQIVDGLFQEKSFKSDENELLDLIYQKRISENYIRNPKNKYFTKLSFIEMEIEIELVEKQMKRQQGCYNAELEQKEIEMNENRLRQVHKYVQKSRDTEPCQYFVNTFILMCQRVNLKRQNTDTPNFPNVYLATTSNGQKQRKKLSLQVDGRRDRMPSELEVILQEEGDSQKEQQKPKEKKSIETVSTDKDKPITLKVTQEEILASQEKLQKSQVQQIMQTYQEQAQQYNQINQMFNQFLDQNKSIPVPPMLERQFTFQNQEQKKEEINPKQQQNFQQVPYRIQQVMDSKQKQLSQNIQDKPNPVNSQKRQDQLPQQQNQLPPISNSVNYSSNSVNPNPTVLPQNNSDNIFKVNNVQMPQQMQQSLMFQPIIDSNKPPNEANLKSGNSISTAMTSFHQNTSLSQSGNIFSQPSQMKSSQGQGNVLQNQTIQPTQNIFSMSQPSQANIFQGNQMANIFQTQQRIR